MYNPFDLSIPVPPPIPPEIMDPPSFPCPLDQEIARFSCGSMIITDNIDKTSKYYMVKCRTQQGKFRQQILAKFGEYCFITNCQVKELVTAAHIIPFSDEQDNSIENGLPLRQDIHTLFDKHLIKLCVLTGNSIRVELTNSTLLKDPFYRHLHMMTIYDLGNTFSPEMLRT